VRQRGILVREALQRVMHAEHIQRLVARLSSSGLLDTIILRPEGEPANRLGIVVEGDLAAMLRIATNEKGRQLMTTSFR
jgi:hypothetical protein